MASVKLGRITPGFYSSFTRQALEISIFWKGERKKVGHNPPKRELGARKYLLSRTIQLGRCSSSRIHAVLGGKSTRVGLTTSKLFIHHAIRPRAWTMYVSSAAVRNKLEKCHAKKISGRDCKAAPARNLHPPVPPHFLPSERG